MDFAQSTNVIPQKMVTPNFDQIPEGINQILNIQKNKVGLEQVQQSLLANKAVSKAIKENTSEDGNLDVPSIISQLSKDENASINLPQLATQLLQLKGQQFTTDTAKLTNLATKNTLAGQRLAPMVADINDNKLIPRERLINEYAHLTKVGVFTPQEAMQHIGMLPEKSNDPEQEKLNIHNFIKNEHLATINNEQLLGKLLPQQQYIGTGAGTQILNVNPLTGKSNPGGFIQGQMPVGTPLVAQEGNNLGLPAGTQYLLGPSGAPTIIPQGSSQGQTTNPAPMVSGLAPTTMTNLDIGNKIKNDAREKANLIPVLRDNSGKIIQYAKKSSTGTGGELLKDLKGGFAGLPYTSDSVTNFNLLGHQLALQNAQLANTPGINNTNAGQELAGKMAGTTSWDEKSIVSATRTNRTLGEIADLFNQGVRNLSSEKTIKFQNKWNDLLKVDTIRLYDGIKNKETDPEAYKEIVKELGGQKSERFINSAKHLDKINELILKGE
jgi:hypothetical protein